MQQGQDKFTMDDFTFWLKTFAEPFTEQHLKLNTKVQT